MSRVNVFERRGGAPAWSRWGVWVVALFAAIGLTLSAAPASAGIIVTVGKFGVVSDEGGRTGDDGRCPESGATPGEGCETGAHAAAPTMPTGGVDTERTTRRTKKPSSASNNTSPSAQTGGGWIDPSNCRPIGGGMTYCDGGQGGAPGAGPGGGLDPEADWDGEDELVVLGCQGGGQTVPLFGLGLLGLFFIARRRRRLS